MGRVQDIFGPVVSPFYVVELSESMDDNDYLKPNLPVFSVAKHAKYIVPQELVSWQLYAFPLRLVHFFNLFSM